MFPAFAPQSRGYGLAGASLNMTSKRFIIVAFPIFLSADWLRHE
jgi:hypothetical protein